MTVYIIYSTSCSEMACDYIDSVWVSREAALERLNQIPIALIPTHHFHILEYAVQGGRPK